MKLLDAVLNQVKAENEMFEDYNYVSEFDEQYDDFNL